MKYWSGNNFEYRGYNVKNNKKDGFLEVYDKYNNYATSDGVYMELFVIKNGVRCNVKIIEMKEVENILTNSLVDEIENLWK